MTIINKRRLKKPAILFITSSPFERDKFPYSNCGLPALEEGRSAMTFYKVRLSPVQKVKSVFLIPVNGFQISRPPKDHFRGPDKRSII
jgi:hypothetical protein